MGNFFPRWTNWLPLKVAIAVVFIAFGVSVGVAYYFTPKYTRVGYEPTQPVPFSHKIHAGQLGLDCRYCHSFSEASSHANVPTNQTCFNCHGPGKGNIRSNSPNLELVVKANETGKSIPWVKIHKAPDYVYFNHSAHLNRGISCVSCHGKINEMEVVRHDQPQSMGWCLDCHRNPEPNLVPRAGDPKPGGGVYEDMMTRLFDVEKMKEDPAAVAAQGALLYEKRKLAAPENCGACHY